MKNNEKKPESILIVDDDTFVCDIYKKIFIKENIETNILHSGKEMIDELEKKDKSYDIIILDIFMSEMDGFEALENAHKKNLLGKSTVVVLSNHADQIAQEKAIKLGAKKFIVKSSLLPEGIAQEVIETFQKQDN